MRDELSHLLQRGMSIPEYEAKFVVFSRYAPQLVSTEEDRCNLFVNGLCDSIRTLVIPQQPKSYYKIVEIATRVEQNELTIQARRGCNGH
ncbi:hypothetical protein AXF42_Ash002173 [Apostasia shenzhenica]|uniref:Uncharacterized protein n=1 Tax=Apostasia shenzhenica TaxID=1088818 RepID=A0A2I0AMS7_9ASPA|nr:hypothetical protein AXF42_Ash002173 [Apostasia shenzhenica]